MKKLFILTVIITCLSINETKAMGAVLRHACEMSLRDYEKTMDYDSHLEWYVGWGESLLSEIRLYEATHEADNFLYSFIGHSHNIIMKTRDVNGVGSSFSNSIPSIQRFHYTGRILYPMSEFITLVYNTPELYNASIPSTLFPPETPTTNGYPTLRGPTGDYHVILGYGDYANWLNAHVKDIAHDFIRTNWKGNLNCFVKESHQDFPAEINMQASWVATLLNMGGLKQNESYVNDYHEYYDLFAKNIGLFFRNEITSYNHAPAGVPAVWSATWLHNPGQAEAGRPEYREDVAHGATDLLIPIYLNRYNIVSSDGEEMFSDGQLNNFARTFTYNIWDRNTYNGAAVRSDIGFRNNVFGMNTGNHTQKSLKCEYLTNVNRDNNFFAPGEVLAWAVIADFDADATSSPHNVYDILFNHAKNLVLETPQFYPRTNCPDPSTYSAFGGGQSIYGLSEIVKLFYTKKKLIPDGYLKSSKESLSEIEIQAIEDYSPKHESNIRIFPNPSDNEVNIEIPRLEGEAIIEIYNFSGQLERAFSTSITRTKIDISKFESGIYLVKINVNSVSKTIKLIKN